MRTVKVAYFKLSTSSITFSRIVKGIVTTKQIKSISIEIILVAFIGYSFPEGIPRSNAANFARVLIYVRLRYYLHIVELKNTLLFISFLFFLIF